MKPIKDKEKNSYQDQRTMTKEKPVETSDRQPGKMLCVCTQLLAIDATNYGHGEVDKLTEFVKAKCAEKGIDWSE